MTTDRELIEGIKQHNEHCFKKLYSRYHKLLANWAYSRLKDWDTTADLIQEFWAEVWLSLRIVELRLVRNKSINETARKLNIAESTVSNNLSKALSTLRQEVALNYGIASADKLKQLLPLLIILMDK